MPIKPLRDGNGEQACFQLWRETWDDREAVMFTIEGEPASKARPRFDGRGSRSRAYTPAGTARAENAIGWLFRREAPRWGLPDKESTFGVVALFFSKTRQRRDVDNMLKLVLDGLTGVAWADDDQVTEASVRKMHLGPDGDARTEVAVYRIGRVHRNCESCGGPVSRKEYQYCQACRWGDAPASGKPQPPEG